MCIKEFRDNGISLISGGLFYEIPVLVYHPLRDVRIRGDSLFLVDLEGYLGLEYWQGHGAWFLEGLRLVGHLFQ